MEDIIKALEDFFAEYGRGRGMEYTYGFMDALAVVREQSVLLDSSKSKIVSMKLLGNYDGGMRDGIEGIV